MKIAFITSSATIDFAPDDRLAVEVARARGHQIDSFVWDQRDLQDLRNYDGAVVRSIWDYYEKYDQFQTWLTELNQLPIRVFNSSKLMKWNATKKYLVDLRESGIPIVPTWITHEKDLDDTLDKLETTYAKQIVVKPTVSAASDLTFLLPRSDRSSIREKVKLISQRSDIVVQPYCKTIETIGEYSLIYFNSPLGKEFSHAILKNPQSGDFRVQVKFGGSITPVKVSDSLIQQGIKALNTLEDDWLYARVDFVVVDDEFCVGEIEVIEPHLYFQYDELAPARFLKHLEARCLN